MASTAPLTHTTAPNPHRGDGSRGPLASVTPLALMVLLGAGLAAAPAPPACACSCAELPVEDHAADADLVARAVVDEVGHSNGGGSGDTVTHRLHLTSVYKGRAGSVVEVRSAASGASCGLEGLEQGSEYLLFATGDGQQWEASLCGGTQRWSSQLDDRLRAVTGTPHTPLPAPPETPANPGARAVPVLVTVALLTSAGASWWQRRRSRRAPTTAGSAGQRTGS